MSYQDARGHTVPAGTDQASRQSLLDLSLSIPSIRACSSASAATQYIAALEASGITPSSEAPAFVMRTDANGLLLSWDGSQWTRHGGGVLSTTFEVLQNSFVFPAAGGPNSLASVSFSLPARSAVLVQASARIRPAGNASGEISIYQTNIAGTRHAQTSWHSQSSTSHQWPTLSTVVWLSAGQHRLNVAASSGPGSTSVTYDLPRIYASYA